MTPVLYRYRFTTINFAGGKYVISTVWLNRRISLAKASDYVQIREELMGLADNENDPDMVNGMLTHAELCGIKLFGIRVL